MKVCVAETHVVPNLALAMVARAVLAEGSSSSDSTNGGTHDTEFPTQTNETIFAARP